MNSDKISSFVNGLIAGAGAVLAIMSFGFLQFVGPLENIRGVTTTELRIAILLGGIVCAVAIGYEFYQKKEASKQPEQQTKKKIEENTEKLQEDQSTDE